MMIFVTEVSTVAFYRPRGGWRDRMRAYCLVVDGSVIGEIRRGQVVRVPVHPGRHQVRATIDWTGSPQVTVDVPAGSEARFRVEPAGNALMVWQVLSLTGWLRLTFEGVASGPEA
ncbi:hypothetical protein [Catellatospora vulcania]|uniref:hypothetical protein n=1 Tax=Catellatospora vulcania TaxID=1460450 RepID=UPI0012D3A96B|nr:hypothetical protein [Catellatospora vulcania]